MHVQLRLISLHFALSFFFLQMIQAAPLDIRAVDQTTFDKLLLFSQFAAAAYCPSNNNKKTPTQIKCPGSNNCPLVESDNVLSVYEFENSFFTDVTGYVGVDSKRKLVILSFRGSHSLQNWIADVDIIKTKTDICDTCTATQGFYGSWLEARSGVKAAVKTALSANPGFTLVVTGHSLGGAIADIAAAEFRNAGLSPTVDLYTYGAPRISGPDLVNYLQNQALQGKGQNYRVTHKNDPVPRLPPSNLGFAHIQPQYFIDGKNGVTVVAASITTFNGPKDGVGADLGLPPYDINAHLWYFGYISACNQ